MKRIILISALLIILLIPQALSQEDYTPTGASTGFINQTTTFDPICSQNAAGISQLISKAESIQETAKQCFKESDLDKFKQEVDEKFERKIGDILSKMVLILLVYTAFFFAIVFLMISKGWLGYGIPGQKELKPTKKEKPNKPKKEEKKEMDLAAAINQFEEEDLFEPEETKPKEDEFDETEAAEHITEQREQNG